MFGLEVTGGVVNARLRSDKVYGSSHRCRVKKVVVYLCLHYPVDPIGLSCFIFTRFSMVVLVCNRLTI